MKLKKIIEKTWINDFASMTSKLKFSVDGGQTNDFLKVVSSIALSKKRSASSQFSARQPPLVSHRASIMSHGSLFKRETRTWQKETTGKNGIRDNYGHVSSPYGNQRAVFFFQLSNAFELQTTSHFKHSMIDLVPLFSPPNILFGLGRDCQVVFKLMVYSIYLTVCSPDIYYKLT